MTRTNTLHELISTAAKRHAARLALIDGAGGGSVTYDELQRRADRIAAWLHEDGVRAGDCVALWLPNVPPFVAFALAAWQLGAVVTALNPAVTDRELASQLADSRASTVVTLPALVERARAAGVSRVIAIGDAAGATPLRELLSTTALAPRVEVEADALAFLPYSSGTTGMPKAVMLTHANLATVCEQLAAPLAVDDRDVTLAAAPFFHILGMTAELLLPLVNGATVVTLARFEPTRFLDLLEQHNVTYLAVPPPVATLLARDPSVPGRDLSALQLIGVGGAPLPIPVQHELAARFPRCTIGQGWGLTETAGVACIPTRGRSTRPGTVGVPLPGTEIRVVDPATGDVIDERGRDGELQVRGPQLMVGYLNRPDDTAAMFDGKWLRTGDLGHLDEDGNVVVVERIKELIKVNAFQVAPAEVEAVLASFPAIADAAVVGRSDERTGEVPIAFVVVRGPLDRGALDAYLREQLAPYKLPAEIRVVDSLPRTPSGKLQRRLLASTEP